MSGESKPNDWPSSKFRPKKSRLKWAAFFWRCIGDNFLSSRETAPETKYVIFQGANIAPRFTLRWSGLTETNAARTQALIVSNDPAVEAEFKDVIAATSAQISKVQKSLESMALSDADKAQMNKIAAARKAMIDLLARPASSRATASKTRP